MDIPLIEDPEPGANPAIGVQYAVQDSDGTVHVYRDQAWVASGQAISDISDSRPGGRVVHRAVTVTYSEWVPASGGA